MFENRTFRCVKWKMLAVAYESRWKCRTFTHPWILGRFACLGQDVLQLLGVSIPLRNVQKGRIDYFYGCLADPSLRARTGIVQPFVKRPDILRLVAQQQVIALPERPPAMIFMDSFAELTDQLFVHREEGWGFCCNHSDVRHDELFAQQFSCSGLLPTEEIRPSLDRFFTMIRERYGSVPILYLHFPCALETREKFRSRGEHIAATVHELAKVFPPLHSVAVAESIVRRPELQREQDGTFPYHYNRETYEEFARKLRKIGVLRMFT